jgi:membrane associated rhomboid family serine protease
MFMHGSFMHILFNMFALYSFGSARTFLGGKSFIFYLSCGLGAVLIHTGINYYYLRME